MTVVGMHVPRRKERKNKETVMNGSTINEDSSVPCCCDPILKPLKRLSSSGDTDHNDFCFKTGFAAFEHVRENMDQLNGKVGATETDLIFLKSLLDGEILQNLVKVSDKLEEPSEPPVPVSTGNIKLSKDLKLACQRSRSIESRELACLLGSPHIQGLLKAHDEIAEKSCSYSVWEEKPEVSAATNGNMSTETYKVVGLRKVPNEPLGLTVQLDENDNLVVARILDGGTIDRQGLLRPGDVILEVNGMPVATPEDLQMEVAKAKENVSFRIVPSNEVDKTGKQHQCHMRALFDYDPADDTLLPCRELGLPFNQGDILLILNQKDPNWWQARKWDRNGPIGLIPSQELEERRKAFVKPEADYVHKISICGTRISKKKRKTMFQSKSSNEFDKAELLLYEEVKQTPPFVRHTLALVGSHGVGRRTLKNRLINSDPAKFGAVVPKTSRPQRELEENGRSYWFVDRETMEQEIKEHKFLEYGEHNGHLYGTSLDTVRDIIRQGKMCVLDCSPASLKILHNSSEFRPYVIFIAAPGMELLKQLYDFGRTTGASNRNLAEDDLKRTVEESSLLQRTYEKYIDMVIINEDFDITFRKVVEAVNTLAKEHQWVPVNWIY
ncbi:MAGUK p55 subfamily member vari isoform X2 [Lycorma delicatula]|uniref:MAGUK p55 subfamily member vari isoform X2 n=1 Tax=Lycorma delicatula TaxID=130591 RepID=UPI003F511B55